MAFWCQFTAAISCDRSYRCIMRRMYSHGLDTKGLSLSELHYCHKRLAHTVLMGGRYMLQRIDFMDWGSTQLRPNSCTYGRRVFHCPCAVCGSAPLWSLPFLPFPFVCTTSCSKPLSLSWNASPRGHPAITKPLDLPDVAHLIGVVCWDVWIAVCKKICPT